jgi:acetyl-CoA C-acetyltransferase
MSAPAPPPSRTLRPVAIVGGVRIPFCRSNTVYSDVGNFGLGLKAMASLVERYQLHGLRLGEVAFGAVIKHASDWNLAREVTLSSGLDPHTPGITLQRACGTSLDAAIVIGNKVATGQIEAGIAGGADTTSDVPVVFGKRFARRLLDTNRAKTFGDKLKVWRGFGVSELKPHFPGVGEPRTGMSMGQHCERMAREWGITRLAQDELALASHLKAAAAYERGFYDDLVVSFRGIRRDNILRPDTTLDKLAQLKPAFDRTSGHGTLTAGNSTALSDGASVALLASEDWARERGLPVRAWLRDARTAAVDFVHGEGLLMAPTYAVAELLKANNLTLQDFDVYEIHEAFAAQVLCTLKAWESAEYCRDRLGLDAPLGSIDPAKLNPVGSSLALGHPFAATGTRVLASAARQLEERGGGRALISVCTAGGMGVCAIVER